MRSRWFGLVIAALAVAMSVWGYAQTDIATAKAAITRPNQRLRMLVSPPRETGHEKPHDFLKPGRIEQITDELDFALRGDEIRSLYAADEVRHRLERNRELLGDLARRSILLGQQLEDLAPGRVGEGSEQRVIHGIDIYTIV